MTNERRQLLLKIGAATCAALLLLDRFVIEPAIQSWTEQNKRVAALQEKVKRGKQLCEREKSLRDRWNGMIQANLPEDVSAAENLIYKALDRWRNNSQILLTSLTPAQWQSREDGYSIMECRLTATGNQASLGRFLYELESDSTLPVSLEECELTTRDARGSQITLTARITFLRLKELNKKATP